MFLCEVALGKEKGITADDSSLKAAPKGYDSIVARGRTEPGDLSICFAFLLHNSGGNLDYALHENVRKQAKLTGSITRITPLSENVQEANYAGTVQG